MSASAPTGQSIVIAGRAFRLPKLPPNRINWMLVSMTIMFIIYWVYVVFLERINGEIVVTQVLLMFNQPEQLSAVTIPRILAVAVEVFHPRVLRHFIPLFVGWWLAVEAATSLVQVLYDCPDRATARDFLRRQRRRGRAPSGPELAVTAQTLHRLEDESVELRVGGPAAVFLPSGQAAVIELNGRFARVVGSGHISLGTFEHIHSIVTLHPQDRSADNIALVTCEGINVTADAQVTFRIDPGADEKSHGQPFPFDPQAVRNVAYAVTVRDNGEESSWLNMPMGRVRGALATAVDQYRLDELIFPKSAAAEPHLAIRNEVEEKVRADLKRNGIQLVRLQLGRFEPPPQVSEQYTDYWQANVQKQSQVSLALGAASTLQDLEVTYAVAEIEMIQAIVRGVQRARGETDDASGYLLAMRLVEMLDKMVRRTKETLPASTTAREQVMPRLAQLQDQLNELESQTQTDLETGPAPPVNRMNDPKPPDSGQV